MAVLSSGMAYKRNRGACTALGDEDRERYLAVEEVDEEELVRRIIGGAKDVGEVEEGC